MPQAQQGKSIGGCIKMLSEREDEECILMRMIGTWEGRETMLCAVA
jgi:hypothetical protein